MHSGQAALRMAQAEREILDGLRRIGGALGLEFDLDVVGHRQPEIRRLRHLEATRDAVAAIAAAVEQEGHHDAEGQRAGRRGRTVAA